MIYDVSMAITPTMTVYKNKAEKVPTFKTLSTHQDSSAHETVLTMSLHTGTHMDFPLHMIQDGGVSDDTIPKGLLGHVKVFDLTHVDRIEAHHLSSLEIHAGDVIFFKTKNSFDEAFDFQFVDVTASAAQYLKDKHIQGVGLDALGIERDQAGHPTHKTLLGEDIFIIEGLRLKEVPQATYELIALPLKIIDVEALPLRVILKTLS